MSEKCELETILTLTKSLINIDLCAVIESANKQVRKTMEEILEINLEIQWELFNQMESDGYYNIQNLDSSDIKKIYNKLIKSGN